MSVNLKPRKMLGPCEPVTRVRTCRDKLLALLGTFHGPPENVPFISLRILHDNREFILYGFEFQTGGDAPGDTSEGGCTIKFPAAGDQIVICFERVLDQSNAIAEVIDGIYLDHTTVIRCK